MQDRLACKREENVKAEVGRRKALYELLTLKSDLDQTKESMRKQALKEAKAEADKFLMTLKEICGRKTLKLKD